MPTFRASAVVLFWFATVVAGAQLRDVLRFVLRTAGGRAGFGVFASRVCHGSI